MNKNSKCGQVRIIGGSARSRRVHFVSAEGLRPSADSVRERLFNWLGQNLQGKTVLDLFSGSGVLAFESLSRGADRVIAVEKNHQIARKIQSNAQDLSLFPQIIHQDALQFLVQCSESFDVVFLDPPYAWNHWEALWQVLIPRLRAGAKVYIEDDAPVAFATGLSLIKEARCGISYCFLCEFLTNDEINHIA